MGTGGIGVARTALSGLTPSGLGADLKRILGIHDRIRTDLYPDSSEEGHLINENTVVRVAAAMEAYDFKPGWDEAKSWEEICAQTAFFFRNAIVHKAKGHLDPRKIQHYSERKRVYETFCRRVPTARVEEGERLCLAGKEVLTPLINGCIEYVKTGEPAGRTAGTDCQTS
jgi:hypothetical protein